MYVLETNRLGLRRMEEADVDHLQLIFSDPEAMQYYPSTKNVDETVLWIQRVQNSYKKNGFGIWVVELKEQRKFVGQCGLIQQDVAGSAEIEIGYTFVRKFWGQGLATEAAIACKQYGFEALGCRKLVSLIDVHNKASQRVAEKNGMYIEKEIFKWEKPIYVYSIDREAFLVNRCNSAIPS